MSENRLKGKIKWYNDEKGFGFIKPEPAYGERDAFLHISSIENYKNIKPGELKEGTYVTYEEKQEERGPKAFNVKIEGKDNYGKTKSPNPKYQERKTNKTSEIKLDEIMLPLRTKTLLQEVDRSSNEPWTDQYSLYANRVSRCDNDGKNMKRGLKEKTDDIGFENRILNKSSEIINQHQKRQEWIFDKMKEQGITVIGIDAATDWRMVIGLGMPSVHDTSMALHHIYGVPYIPASALKGGFRSWVINEIYGAVEGNAKSGALSDPFFCHLFGAPSTSATGERKGKICFFDTLPKKVPKMEEDIMNVHYQQYYSDTKAYPGDYYSPIPVTFRPVSSADFRINLAVKKKDESLLNEKLRTSECMAQEKYKDIDSFLKVQMKKFLEWQGIGAKTALGYGTLGSSGSQDH